MALCSHLHASLWLEPASGREGSDQVSQEFRFLLAHFSPLLGEQVQH